MCPMSGIYVWFFEIKYVKYFFGQTNSEIFVEIGKKFPSKAEIVSN